MRFRLMLMSVLSMATNVVCSQTDSIVGKVHTVDEVVVQSKNIDANVLSSTPTQAMSGERINALGIVSLADAVKKFAGVGVRDYGGIGGLKTVSVRNLGAHHTMVSYDGIAVSNAQAGQVDISRFTTDNLSKLSFSIGQVADFMQSARHYASAGVLDIQSVRPHFSQHTYSIRVHVNGGSFGMVNPSVSYWQQLGEATSLSLHATYMRADGVYPFTLKNGYLKTREKRYNSDVHSGQGEVNLYHVFNNGDELQLKSSYYQSERGLPGSVILYNYDAKERLWDKNFYAQTEYKKRLSRQWQLRCRFKYNYAWDKYEDINSKYQGGKQTDINRQHEFYVSATLGWKLSNHWSFALAEDVFANVLNSNFNSMQPLRLTSLSVLSSWYEGGRLIADAFLVFTHAHERVKVGTAPDDRNRLSPALSLSYRLLKDESLFARAMVKSTFRIPSFNDLYYQRIGNNKLRPERAMEYNVGLTWSHQVNHLNFHVTTDAYYNKVNDKIVAFPSTYVWKMVNFGKVDITGLDATMGMDMTMVRGWSAELLATYTWQNAIDKLDDDKQIPYTPKHYGGGSLILHTPYVTIGYNLTGCGERYSNMMHTDEYRLHPYWEHSVTFSREWKFRGFKCDLLASMLNITNEQYEIVEYYPMPGRSWRVGFTISF